MKKPFILILVIITIASYSASAQVAINTDASEADPSAMLDVKSNEKGMLIPRMTQAEIIAISNPSNGLQVFNTDDGKIYVFILADNRWKELQYGSGELFLPASYSIGTGGSCSNTAVNGVYNSGSALDGSHTVNIDVDITEVGTWIITTNIVNGYSFSGSGVFTTTGTEQITLYGSGLPIDAQTDNFIATANAGGGTCTFSVDVIFTCGSSFIYIGKNYSTIQIGAQCWMAENLNVGTMISSGTSQTNNGTMEKYCYDNSESYCDTYGGLYQWDEMMLYVTTEGVKGICPTGWHLPSDSEWCTLDNEVDAGSFTCNTFTGQGTDCGYNIKTTSGWVANGNGSDLYGFTAHPAGHISSGSFQQLAVTANFWTSTIFGPNAIFRKLYYNRSDITRGHINQQNYGFSVRCLKD